MPDIEGLDELLRKLKGLPQNLEKEIEEIVEDNTRQLARSAKRFAGASVDLGFLRNSIRVAKNGKLEWRVVVLAKYGPYIEFGTGGLVRVPDELKELALQFKGRGVKKIDIRPQPYLYPAFELQRDQFIKDIKDLLESETGKL